MTPDHHGEIAERAYSIWEREGRPSGRDLDHWLHAEAEVKAQRTEAATDGATPTARVEVSLGSTPAKLQQPAPRRTPR